MDKTIYWRVFVNSKDMDKAKRICDTFTLCIAGRCQLRKCEKYWKDKNLIEVEIVQEMNVPSTQHLLIDLFKNTRAVIHRMEYQCANRHKRTQFRAVGHF